MTLQQVRQLAMSLPETTEAPHFDRTSFRMRGKIIATALPDDEYLNVFVSDEERDSALAAEPDFLEPLRWGKRSHGVRVFLPGAKPDVVKKLLVQAWTRKAPKKLVASVSKLADDGGSTG